MSKGKNNPVSHPHAGPESSFPFSYHATLSLPPGLCQAGALYPHFPTAPCWFWHLLPAPPGGHFLAEGSSDFSHGPLYPSYWLGGHVVAFACPLACLLSLTASCGWEPAFQAPRAWHDAWLGVGTQPFFVEGKDKGMKGGGGEGGMLLEWERMREWELSGKEQHPECNPPSRSQMGAQSSSAQDPSPCIVLSK